MKGVIRLLYENLTVDHSRHPVLRVPYSFHVTEHFCRSIEKKRMLIVSTTNGCFCTYPTLKFYILLNLFSSWIYREYLPLECQQPTIKQL